MSPRERLLSVLEGKQPDRVPWFGDLDYWANSLVKRGLKPEDFIASDDYISWHRDLGVGFYLQGYFPFRHITDNCKTREWNEGYRRFKEIETPFGTVRECWEYMPSSFCEAPVEHFMKSEEDIPSLKFIYENSRFEPDYDLADIRKQQVGDQGFVLCYLPKSPFMHLLALEAGVMAVTMIALNAPDEFRGLLDAMDRAFDMAAQIAVESPAEVLMIPENLSSEMVGPDFFELYMRDYQMKWTDRIRAAGKYSFIHIDGTLTGLLRQEASVGFNVLEALTPYPVGDIRFEELSDFIGDSKSIIWGGIPGSYFTNCVSDIEFDRHVKYVLSVMTKKPRYVLGVADQVPPDGLERRVKRVSHLIEKFGRY
ncbi:MAG: uroporphyrinogen decarboxylase family protein [Bacteroidales bacterium]|jgi:uroporphyrinogen-III decarboxylase|nr:uroporphyrinogen decarboxylase family protein [Bacteroidales bacterium]